MTKPKQVSSRRCAFKCPKRRKLFRIPENKEIRKLWLSRMGLSEKQLCRSEMYVCLDHFSSRQLTVNGKTITPTSLPDKNIPSTQTVIDYVNKSNPPSQIVVNQSYLCDTSGAEKVPTVTTSEFSRCVLKCSSYTMLHRFPHDLASYNVWLKKLGIPESTKLIRTATVCNNHFSAAMRTKKTITPCAVPDTNLPSQCEFIPYKMAELRQKEIHTTKFDGTPLIDVPIIFGDSASTFSLTKPDPIAKPPIIQTKPDVICPENYENALFECVLKCPDSKILYRFPNSETRRQLWLSKIGLTHCFCNTRICSRHFSEKMLSNKRLTNSSYPDINLQEISRIRVASLPLQNEVQPVVQELPQYICVRTVVSNNKNIEAMVNSTKYVKYTVDKKTPKRERSVQVELDDLIKRDNKAITADEEMDEDNDDYEKLETFEIINLNEKSDLSIKSQVFPSKTKDMFECLKCGEITVDQESNRRHLDQHKELSHLCFQCGRKFKSDVKLNEHEMKVHSMTWKHLVKRCPKEHCKKAFHSKKNLNRHLNEHFKRAKHYCSKCGRLFFSSLKLHCHLLACKPKNIKAKTK